MNKVGEGSSQHYPVPEEDASRGVDPLRLQNLEISSPDNSDHKDLYSPVTPTDPDKVANFFKYAAMETLPQPVENQDGRSVQFGSSVRVPKESKQDYQDIREHAIKGGQRAQKYLYAAENGPRQTTVYPFTSRTQPISTLEGSTLEPKTAFANMNSGDNIIRYNKTEASMSINGEVISAHTVGVHELFHAARNPEAENIKPLKGGWTNTEEHHIITKSERDVAEAHGEGPRDSHYGWKFRTAGGTSTEPINPSTKAIINEYQPKLRETSRRLDEAGLSNFASQTPEFAAKGKLIGELDKKLPEAEKLRESNTPPPSPTQESPDRPILKRTTREEEDLDEEPKAKRKAGSSH